MGDAVELRKRILLAFEEAERRRADTGTQSRLNFVIVGGGPTGVELAGALLDIGRKTMGPDYPHLRAEDLSITLVEAGSRILSGFNPTLSAKALTVLEQMGVTVKLNTPVTAVRADGVMVGEEWVASANVIWAAGNKASPLLATLGVDQDPSTSQGSTRSDDPRGSVDLRHRRCCTLPRPRRHSPARDRSRRHQ